MSRVSHGGLEVERYIGSCLISSTVRPNLQKTSISTKKQEQSQLIGQRNNNSKCYSPNNYSSGQDHCQYNSNNNNNNWTVSMTSSPRRNNQRLSPPPCQQLQQQQQQHLPIDQSQQQQSQQQHLQNRSPLSRLAIHTQGAPLIVTGRYQNRGKIQNCNNIVNNSVNVNNFCNINNNIGTTMSIGRCMPQRGAQKPIDTSRKFQQQIQQQQQQQQQQHQNQIQNQQLNCKNDCQTPKADNTSITNVANIDSLSIASDESSNNSENSLPRIIKPRKRRKKDRKPTNTILNDTTKQDDQIITTNSDQLNSVTIKPYVTTVNYDTRYDSTVHRSHRRPPVGRESYNRIQTSPSMQDIVDTRQRFAHRHVQVKVLDDNRNIIVDAPIRTMSVAKGYRNYHHPNHLVNNTGNRINNNNNNSNNNNNNNNNNNSNNNIVNINNDKNISTFHVDHYDNGCERIGIVDDSGSCQCRYCDPSGLIWDVDQHVYSPYLTPSPPHTSHEFNGLHYSHLPLFMSRSSLDSCQEQVEYFDVEDPLRIHHHHQQHNHHHHHHQNQHQQQQHQQQQHHHHQRLPSGNCRQERLEPNGCSLLRRSWSDPTSYFSDQISTPIRDIGVIGDRGQTDVPRGRSSWPGSASSGVLTTSTNLSGLGPTINSETSVQSLEVSTEIVTSLNGHRDLEIKFYSSSPNAANTEEEKSLFNDDNEDFSDIWSYHESKLQQDFRTLLQAEE